MLWSALVLIGSLFLRSLVFCFKPTSDLLNLKVDKSKVKSITIDSHNTYKKFCILHTRTANHKFLGNFNAHFMSFTPSDVLLLLMTSYLTDFQIKPC